MALQAGHGRALVQALGHREADQGVGHSCWRAARRRGVLLDFQDTQGMPHLPLAAAAGADPNLAGAESLQVDLHANTY